MRGRYHLGRRRVDLHRVRRWLVSIADGPNELLAVPSGQLLPGACDGADRVQLGLLLVERQRGQLHTVRSRLVSEPLKLDKLRDVSGWLILRGGCGGAECVLGWHVPGVEWRSGIE